MLNVIDQIWGTVLVTNLGMANGEKSSILRDLKSRKKTLFLKWLKFEKKKRVVIFYVIFSNFMMSYFSSPLNIIIEITMKSP